MVGIRDSVVGKKVTLLLIKVEVLSVSMMHALHCGSTCLMKVNTPASTLFKREFKDNYLVSDLAATSDENKHYHLL